MPSIRPLLWLFVLVPSLAFAQNPKPIQHSENGWHLSPHGTIRILVLFVEIDFDVSPDKDPQPEGAAHWAKGQLPTWKDKVFDPHPLPVQQAEVTRYYQDISHGQYTVLGDYVNEVIILKESKYPDVHSAHSIGSLAAQEVNERGVLRTRHNLSIEDFDLWKDGGKPGQPKVQGPDEPHSYDHVMAIVRNSALGHGQGSTDPGSIGNLFGYQSDTQSRFGAKHALPFEILKHEFNHLLIGGNNFHSGGGNAAQFESNFMCLQGGWSMMGASGSSLLTCCAWDRDRMGWKPEGTVHRIHIHDLAGNEVNGDLDPASGDTGLFVLRDFVPSGDALRIRMPFISEDRLPQWLWVENHQGFKHNGSPTDRFHYEATNDCVEGMDPGLFMTMQVGRELREGTNIYGGVSDYLRPVLANGNFDQYLRGDTLHNICPFGGDSSPYFRDADRANPFTGNHEQELPVYDRNNDGLVQRAEHWVPGTRIEKGQPDRSVILTGRPEHAFRMNGVRHLGMCTNPSSANMLTLISTNTRDTHGRKAPNVRTTYLNGIGVELISMQPNGDAIVRVRNDDTRLESDQRWCADSIVLPPLRGKDGHSLTIAGGKRLLVDRSLTPTRMNEPDTSSGIKVYTSPTRFNVLGGASIHVEEAGTLQLSNGSVLSLQPNSRLILHHKAQLKIDRSCQLIVGTDAQLEGKSRMIRRLRKGGRIMERRAQ